MWWVSDKSLIEKRCGKILLHFLIVRSTVGLSLSGSFFRRGHPIFICDASISTVQVGNREKVKATLVYIPGFSKFLLGILRSYFWMTEFMDCQQNSSNFNEIFLQFFATRYHKQITYFYIRYWWFHLRVTVGNEPKAKESLVVGCWSKIETTLKFCNQMCSFLNQKSTPTSRWSSVVSPILVPVS